MPVMPHLRSTYSPSSGPNSTLYSSQDFSDLHIEALQVVANCLSDSESLKVIHKSGGLMRLMEFLLTPNMPEIQYNAVKCICSAAQSREYRGRHQIRISFSF